MASQAKAAIDEAIARFQPASGPQLAASARERTMAASLAERIAGRGARRPPPLAASFFDDSEGTGFLNIVFGSGHYKTLAVWAVMPPRAEARTMGGPASRTARASTSIRIISSSLAIFATCVIHRLNLTIALLTMTARTFPSLLRGTRLQQQLRGASAHCSLDAVTAVRPI